VIFAATAVIGAVTLPRSLGTPAPGEPGQARRPAISGPPDRPAAERGRPPAQQNARAASPGGQADGCGLGSRLSGPPAS
jgi:hypothetical protein